jgi:uncharacterized cupredoxin-like copper-binding protein
MDAQRRAIGTLAAGWIAALALAGCGGGGGSAGSTSSSGASTTPAASGTAVTATETEFSIALSQQTFAAGTYTFTVQNSGNAPHNLTIKGPGADNQASPTLQGGQSGTVTVTLQAGSYELYCSVDGHKAQGMDMTITVS